MEATQKALGAIEHRIPHRITSCANIGSRESGWVGRPVGGPAEDPKNHTSCSLQSLMDVETATA